MWRPQHQETRLEQKVTELEAALSKERRADFEECRKQLETACQESQDQADTIGMLNKEIEMLKAQISDHAKTLASTEKVFQICV